MSVTHSISNVNRLLAKLKPPSIDRLLVQSARVKLSPGAVLCDHNQPISHAYFPLTGSISQVTSLDGHHPLEIGLIGNEGMLGASLILNVPIAPMRAIVHSAGTALQISVDQFQQQMQQNAELHTLISRYLHVLIMQLGQHAACAHFHEIEPRLARWLLMTHDREQSNHFHLTHEFLAGMLGVRRSGITIAAGALQQKRLISYTRGDISIIDRDGLHRVACGCYDALNESYQRFLT